MSEHIEPMSDAELAEIESRANAATPGPWHLSSSGDNQMIVQTQHVTRDVWTIPHVAADQPFIAHARADVPRLLAEVRRLRAIVDRLPKTADGVAVVPGVDAVWWPKDGKIYSIPVGTDGRAVAWTFDAGRPDERQVLVIECYSTRAAAEAAGRPK